MTPKWPPLGLAHQQRPRRPNGRKGGFTAQILPRLNPQNYGPTSWLPSVRTERVRPNGGPSGTEYQAPLQCRQLCAGPVGVEGHFQRFIHRPPRAQQFARAGGAAGTVAVEQHHGLPFWYRISSALTVPPALRWSGWRGRP